MPLHLHHSFRPHTLSLPNLSLPNLSLPSIPSLSFPSLRFRSGKSSTSTSTSSRSNPSSHSSSTSSSSPPPPPPAPYISKPSPISPSFPPPHGPHTSTSQAPYVTTHRNRNRNRNRTITVPGTAVPDDANFILEFKGRPPTRARSRSRGRREGRMQMQMHGGNGAENVATREGQGETLGVRISDALNWTGLADPEERVFGCCPHESIVLSCFWPAPGTFPSEPFTIPVRNERGESYTARMIAYVVAQEFREMITTSPTSSDPDPTLPDFRLVRSSYTGPRRDPGIRLEDLWITRLWSRDGRVFWVEVRLEGA